MPVDGDVGDYLRATASYTDGQGPGKNARAVTDNRVQAAPATNGPPEFPAGETGQRSVAENTGEGAGIGAPVEASDPDNDTLTYELSGPDAGAFRIVSSTGQLQTRAALNHESRSSYSVVVTAVDPSNESDAITVAITVTDVNEAPEFLPIETGVRSVPENTGAGQDIGAPVTAEDQENDTLTYALAGNHARFFDIDTSNGQLRTGAALDHEARASYSVTVTVTDGRDADGNADTGTDGSIAITVIVTNQEEEGTLTLSTAQPRVGDSLSATLRDPDGGVSNLTWGWERSPDGNTWSGIVGANSRSYTPQGRDQGHHLGVTASYTDGQGPGKSAQAESAQPVQAPSAPPPSPPPPPPGSAPGPAPAPPASAEPGIPTIQAVAPGQQTLAVAWAAPNSDGGAAITAYDLRYIRSDAADKSDAHWSLQPGAWTPGDGSLGDSITGLEDGLEYDVQVRAVNSAGPGPWSATVTGATEAAPPSADPCVTPLGVLTSATTESGTWTGNCDSASRGGSHARFYSFTIEGATEVTIDLSSDQDTYIYLLQGAGREGTQLDHNDDVETGNTDSQISRTLDPGDYTVEATTYSSGITGNFILSILVPGDTTTPPGPAPGPEPAPQPTGDPCLFTFGTLTAAATAQGEWTEDCASTNQEGAYAHFYSFTLETETTVTIDLTSDQDTYLFLLEGAGREGALVASNDDVETGNTDSQIIQTLDAGGYTVEATTYSTGVTGSFTVSISGPAAGATPPPADDCLTPLAPDAAGSVVDLPGTWNGDCASTNREGSYARYYSFTLGTASEVTITTVSRVDTVLHLLEGTGRTGTSLFQNDDIETGNTNSQIVQTLEPGAYTIEVTTYTAGDTGDFSLAVTGLEAGTGEPPPADSCVTDLGTLGTDPVTLTSAWAGHCDSTNREGRYARFYTFTLTQETQVTIDLHSETDTYLYLLQGPGRVGTTLHQNDDVETGVNANSRISETLPAGTYTIEATTYSAGDTGDFTLTIAQ